MKTVNFTGKSDNAYGKPLETPIPWSGSYQAYESIGEVRASNAFPSDEAVLLIVNNKRKAAAKAAAMVDALKQEGYEKPTLESEPQLQLKAIYKALIAAKKTHEEARAIASSTLGIEWADEDE